MNSRQQELLRTGRYWLRVDPIKNRLREIRIDRGLTQEQLGRMVHLSKNAISSMENCDYLPRFATAMALGLALNTPPDLIWLCSTPRLEEYADQETTEHYQL